MAICRRKLDVERGNPWICECPLCQAERERRIDEELFLSDGTGQGVRSQPKDDLPSIMGEGDTSL
jgi:hypothetical protein